MIQAKRSFVRCGDWLTRISHFELCNRVFVHPCRDKICRDSALACLKVLVPVEIFQFSDMHYETERYRDSTDGLQLSVTGMHAQPAVD